MLFLLNFILIEVFFIFFIFFIVLYFVDLNVFGEIKRFLNLFV